MPSSGASWGSTGSSVDELAAQADGPAGRIGPQQGQQAVIISAPSAQPETALVEGEARDECPVDRRRGDLGQAGPRLGDAENPRD